jgi:predicted NBD/HSP70 family sugar kinase
VGTAAILSLGRRALRQGAEPLGAMVREAGGALTPALISLAAEHGDAAARGIWVEIGRWLGIGLANLVNLLNPDRIVLAGGVANAWAFFYPTVRDTVRAEAMTVSARAVRIVRARLGERAGILGASLLVYSNSASRNR